MSEVPKECLGCQSIKRYGKISGCTYIFNREIEHVFRTKFCPCVLCITKVMCTNKIDRLSFNFNSISYRNNDKCPEFRRKLNEFREYSKNRGLYKTKLRRKKRK